MKNYPSCKEFKISNGKISLATELKINPNTDAQRMLLCLKFDDAKDLKGLMRHLTSTHHHQIPKKNIPSNSESIFISCDIIFFTSSLL